MTHYNTVIGDELGPPEAYAVRPHDPGQSNAGQVRFRIHAANVSFVDTLIAAGKYQLKPELPFIPGSECAGVVESVGESVTEFQAGDAVMASRMGGGFSQVSLANVSELTLKPAGLSFEEAAAFKVSYTTAYHALKQRGRLQSGETVLVLGAAGGVGYAAIQIAKAMGARVIASASTEAKRKLALAGGADAAIDSKSQTWRSDVKAANVGKPVDIVVDPVGGDMTELGFRSLAWNGRHLVIGFAAGGIPRLPTNLPLLKGASLVGVDIRQFGLNEPAIVAKNWGELCAMQSAHQMRPPIEKTFGLEQFAEAMELVGGGGATGRIILSLG